MSGGDITAKKPDDGESPEPAGEDATRTMMGESVAAVARASSSSFVTWKHFEIRKLVGTGGFGDVYLAWDTQLRREVALKILKQSGMGDENVYEEILNEARALARVRHANVVPVYGVAREEGRIGFWSEYIRGQNLSQLLRAQGCFGEREAVLIGMDVCRAVTAVHGGGWLHRDIKAANVIREDGGRILLMDFGLSHDVGHARHNGGTPHYMAPELLAGEQPTVASDIYAIGVLLFHLVTLKYPVEGETWSELGVAHQKRDRKSLFDFRSDVSPAFMKVLDTATQREPSARFASAGQMLAALAEVSGTRVITEGGAGQTRRWMLAAAVVMAILGGIGIPMALRQTGVPIEPGGAVPDRYLSAQRFLLRSDKPGNVDKAVDAFQAMTVAEPNNALAHSGLARAYWMQFGTKRDPHFLDLAKETANHALQLNPKLTPVHVTLGKIQVRMGNHALAEQELQHALELDRTSSDVWSALGDLYNNEGRKAEAEEAIQKAIQLSPDDWRYSNQLGLLEEAAGKYDGAMAAYKDALRLTPDNAAIWSNLGNLYSSLRDFQESEKAYRKSIELNPSRDLTYSNLGSVLLEAGKFGEAVQALEQALRLNPLPYKTWGNLAAAYQWSHAGEDKTKGVYREARQRAEKEKAATPRDAQLLAILGSYQMYLGERESSLRLTRQALALDPENPAVLRKATQTFETAGLREEALKSLSGALAHGVAADEMLHKPDLAGMSKDPRFEAILRKAQNQAENQAKTPAKK